MRKIYPKILEVKKNIIQFNNEFFSSSKEILSQDYIKIYDNSQQTFSFSKEGGYVKIDLFDQLVFEENMLQQIIFLKLMIL